MNIHSDKSLMNPKDDKLGYSFFAKHLADSIIKLDAQKGLVISVYGKWGLGKSTVLNFTKHYIDIDNGDLKPFVMEFNPWWFSGTESILNNFFNS